tara:strand:+ start:203 stop:478 length:276 start_codon:yes stop_codon:yes gene_type:complete
MAITYELIPKEGQPLEGLAQFIQVDELICTLLRVKPDPVKWVGNWENKFGIGLACGKSWDDLRNGLEVDDDLSLDILDILESHYTVRNWSN